MKGSQSDDAVFMGDTFFETTWGPLAHVILIADPMPGAPLEKEVWDSWDDRCNYVGVEDFDPGPRYRKQKIGKDEQSFPALHAAHAVRVDLQSVIGVARTYLSKIKSDPRYDQERSRSGERLLKRGDRMSAEIGIWPWALPGVRNLALAEELPPAWNWQKANLVHPGYALRGYDSPIEGMTRGQVKKLAKEQPDRFNDLFEAGLASRASS
jgi:hypothetical protein